MFNIQPKLLKFAGLLEKRLFRIPHYQRAYSWHRAEREDLFNDIRKLRDKPGTSHFMATVVGLHRRKIEIGTDEYAVIEIVDGQQRLTTLVILLKVIAEKLASLLKDSDTDVITLALPDLFVFPDDMNDPYEGETIQKAHLERELRELQGLLVKQDEVTEILLQTNHDRSQYFANFLRDGTLPKASEAQTVADRELLRAMHECQSFVQRWGNPMELLRLLKNQLWFIFHETNDVETVYTVFEVLNNRGLEVSWLAKLKSRLMEVASDVGQDNRGEHIEKLHRIWGDFYATVGLRDGIDTEALRFASTLRSQYSVSKVLDEESAVGRLMNEVGKSVAKTIDVSNWLVKVVNAVNRLQAEMKQPVTRIRHARLLAIAIMLRDFPDQEERELLNQWEKTTFRIFGLCRKDARTGVGDFVRLAREIQNNLDLSSDDVSEMIHEIGSGYTVDEAEDQLWDSDCYTKWKEELRYLLYRYEEHLAQQRGVSLPIQEWKQIWKESAANSIEHILPQSKGSQDWQGGIYVHRLGNLLLLPPRVNSTLRDKDPEAKADAYRGTRLHIAEEVAETIQSDGWDKPEVTNREAEILEWIKEEYDC